MDADLERMPGDHEAAAAIAAMSELGGWSVGDRLAFTAPELGLTKPTAARVCHVFPGGDLLIEPVSIRVRISPEQARRH